MIRETAMTRYVGILDGEGDVWGVTLPDIDGCVGAGATPEEAIESATIALREVAAHSRAAVHRLRLRALFKRSSRAGSMATRRPRS